MSRHVNRVADVKEDALESLYEKRLRKKSLLKEKDENLLQVDPVDALPVKTPDGKIVFRTGNFNPTFNFLVYNITKFSRVSCCLC